MCCVAVGRGILAFSADAHILSPAWDRMAWWQLHTQPHGVSIAAHTSSLSILVVSRKDESIIIPILGAEAGLREVK